MKFKVGDQVIITSGKDKGKKTEVVKVLPVVNKVIVKDVNMYTKHVKPMGERAGERIRKERPLSVANIAILNDKGQPDRVGYQVAKDGSKERVFKKTGKAVPEQKIEKKK
jgi:large subunit ribosomal protein L24